jgi:hypothetical protein
MSSTSHEITATDDPAAAALMRIPILTPPANAADAAWQAAQTQATYDRHKKQLTALAQTCETAQCWLAAQRVWGVLRAARKRWQALQATKWRQPLTIALAAPRRVIGHVRQPRSAATRTATRRTGGKRRSARHRASRSDGDGPPLTRPVALAADDQPGRRVGAP